MKTIRNTLLWIVAMLAAWEAKAQGNPLVEQTWKVKQHYAQFQESKYFYYHKDSLSNNLSYNAEYTFAENGTYLAKDLSTNQSFEGKWLMNAKKDTMTLDGKRKHLYQLDPMNLVLRTYSLQYVDTSAKKDTVFTYMHLYAKPTVTALGEETTASSHFFVSPNPTISTLNISLLSTVTDPNGSLVVYTMQNQEVFSTPFPIKRGDNTLYVHLPKQLTRGMYLVKIHSKDYTKTAKVLLVE